MWQQKLLVVVMCMSLGRLVDSSQQVIKDFSLHFRIALDVCRAEMDIPDTVYKDFDNFWEPDYEITNRQTGCAIMCLSFKLELVDPDLVLHHGNAHEYMMKHGADPTLAKELVDFIHVCGQKLPEVRDDCIKVLEWAKCFKAKVHKKGIAPPLDLIMGEVLAEM